VRTAIQLNTLSGLQHRLAYWRLRLPIPLLVTARRPEPVLAHATAVVIARQETGARLDLKV